MSYEAVIGLEVHVQLATQTKLFCGCTTTFGQPPNTQVCPVCSGQPGALPVLNQKAVEYAVAMGLALGCDIRQQSYFARKNYFYPDLPKGYQISQFDRPIAEHGQVELWLGSERKQVRINRIHLEDDAGKTIHGPRHSLVDLNRAGVPLIEIVSEPDLRSPEEAAEYMRTLRAIVRTLGVSDGNLEQGSLRCDANISLRPVGSEVLGTRAELKNINSFRFVQKALEYEITRQEKLLKSGGAVVQETRLYDSERGVTESMRSKEESHDYRYFPDPDLPVVLASDALVAEVRDALPELPLARRQRYLDLGLSDQDANGLTKERELGDYFDQLVSLGAKPKRSAGWLLTELLARVADARDVLTLIAPGRVAELLKLVDAGKLSLSAAKKIWPEMLDSDKSAEQIAQDRDLFQQSDAGAIEAQVEAILSANPDKVEAYRQGKDKLLGWFVGQVMRASRGKANPAVVNELVRKHLAE